jgi:trehalose-6-phosphate synthase
LINPYDIEQTANALDEALTMDLPVRLGRRMRRMRVSVSSWTSAEWSAQISSRTLYHLCSSPAIGPRDQRRSGCHA